MYTGAKPHQLLKLVFVTLVLFYKPEIGGAPCKLFSIWNSGCNTGTYSTRVHSYDMQSLPHSTYHAKGVKFTFFGIMSTNQHINPDLYWSF